MVFRCWFLTCWMASCSIQTRVPDDANDVLCWRGDDNEVPATTDPLGVEGRDSDRDDKDADSITMI